MNWRIMDVTPLLTDPKSYPCDRTPIMDGGARTWGGAPMMGDGCRDGATPTYC